jgi:hypothetical protein
MSEIDLESKFPEMRPISGVPSLWTIHGCGLSVYGHRDFDEETYTYVKTRFFCLLMIPLVAIDAYRVADGPTGLFFLGRVPLAPGARMWNCLFVGVVLTVIGLFGWHKYTHTADYVAGQRMAEADRLAAAGDIEQAAQMYREIALGDSSQAGRAVDQVKALLDGPAAQAPAKEVAAVLAVAVKLRNRHNGIPNLFERGSALAAKHTESDPRGAVAILTAIASAADKPNELNAKLRPLLERLVAEAPDDLDTVARLAVVYEAEQQWDKCEGLLKPQLKKLGTSEGARILGQIYSRQGKWDEAQTLLLPYTEIRVKRLHDAEKKFADAQREFQEKIVEEVRQGTAPNFDFKAFRQAGREEQDRMLAAYFSSRFKNDSAIESAREGLLMQVGVVSVALDLGIVMLRRGQSLPEPAAKKAQLEKAEQMFLSLRSVAGKSEEYQLNLGQVYYWLGKPVEGRKLFDEVLQTHERQPEMLVRVSRSLREVGANTEARALAEEAYEKAKDQAKKYDAAEARSLLATDLEDEIAWLRRADPAAPNVQALLSLTRGQKAVQDGDDAGAAKFFREAIDTYARQPQSTATLNNGALAYASLFQVTGDLTALVKQGEMFEKAAALRPGDSVLITNSCSSILGSALREMIGPAIDLKTLRMEGGIGFVSFLYDDKAGREKYVARFGSDREVARALAGLDRLVVLAPKNSRGYAILARVYGFTRNAKALEDLNRRLADVDLDLGDAKRETLDWYAGKKDDKDRKEMKARVTRYEELVRKTRPLGGPTFAIAVETLCNQMMSLAELEESANANELVSLAEEAFAAAPSQGVNGTLMNTLMFRAYQDIARQDPDFATMVKRARRSLSPSYLVALALARGGKRHDAVNANPDVRRIVAMALEDIRKFPDESSPWIWALLKNSHPAEAAQLAKAYLQDSVEQSGLAIAQRLNPLDGKTAFRAYWAKQMAGQEAEGIKILKVCAAQGVPMPFDLPQ